MDPDLRGSCCDGLQKRLLVDVKEQVEQLLAVVFENYKSLDEDSASGLADISAPVLGSVGPALVPAVQIYTLVHDILSLESQNTLRNYFKVFLDPTPLAAVSVQ